MLNRTGLVLPYSTNASDGNASGPELTTAEEILEQIEAPIRDARSGALKDAVTYLTDNAVNGANHNVRAAINIRWNLAWAVVDEIICQARPLAEREIEKVKAARIRIEVEQIGFEKLAALFTDPVRVQISGDDADRFDLLGLTESQLRLCANVLGPETPQTVARRKDGKPTATKR